MHDSHVPRANLMSALLGEYTSVAAKSALPVFSHVAREVLHKTYIPHRSGTRHSRTSNWGKVI